MTPANGIRRIFFTCLLATVLAPLVPAQQLDRTSWGERFNSEGASLRFMEMQRTPRSEGGTWVHYFLQAIAMPRNRSYTLWEWELGGEPKLLFTGVTLRDDGVLLCSGKPNNDCSGATEEQVYAARLVAMKGEPRRFALVSADNRARVFSTAVAFPIQAQDQKCKVSLERKSPDASEVTLTGTGFQPRERVTLSVASEAAGATLRRNADETGNWSADLARTADAAHATGDTQVVVKARQCNLSLPWQWGTDAKKIE